VSDGVNNSISTPISISVGSPPTATILSPQDGSLFVAGDVIAFSGDASDPDDGSLPPSAYTWNIDFLHESHVHPGIPITGVKSGTFTIPTTGHDFSGNTRYRITLTVTDSTGLTATSSVLVFPRKVNLTFSTAPAGLTLYLDGIVKATPFTYDTLIGFNHTVEARNQTSGSTSYTFASWSDGGAQTHTIVVPSTDQAYVATFQAGTSGGPFPVSSYGFDEGSGTTVADSSGNGNAGSIGAATWTSSGKFGGALNFNGTSARVTIPDAPSLRLSTGMTLEAWVYPTAVTSAWRDVVYKGDDNYFLMATSAPSGRPAGGGQFSGAGAEVYGNSNLPANTWSHVAVTYDGATLRLFLNGTEVANVVRTGNLASSTNPLQVGGDAIYGQYFTGRIDEVRVYNIALSAAQVLTDMNAAVGGGPPTDTQPPTAPSGLQANAFSSTQVNLSWTAATDNVGVTSYRVERCQGAGCSNFAEIAQPTGTTFSDTGRSPSTSYSYRVRASDAAANVGPYSGTASATTPAATSGLIAAYSFNEGTGSTVADASGTGNGGSIGSATWTTSGKYGGALSFNGTNARVTVPDAPSLRLTNAMTLEAWVYPTAITNKWRDVVYKGDDNYYLEATSSPGRRPAAGGTFSGVVGETSGGSILATNTWAHLATTYDGTTLRLYVNGTQVSSKSQTGLFATSSNPLQIGGDALYGQYFSGRIDEVRIYKTALTQPQIQTDMNAPIAALAARARREMHARALASARGTLFDRGLLLLQTFPFHNATGPMSVFRGNGFGGTKHSLLETFGPQQRDLLWPDHIASRTWQAQARASPRFRE